MLRNNYHNYLPLLLALTNHVFLIAFFLLSFSYIFHRCFLPLLLSHGEHSYFSKVSGCFLTSLLNNLYCLLLFQTVFLLFFYIHQDTDIVKINLLIPFLRYVHRFDLLMEHIEVVFLPHFLFVLTPTYTVRFSYYEVYLPVL